MIHAIKNLFHDAWYDEKFKRYKSKYILQCLLITIILLCTFLFLNILPNAVVLASIGATSFIIFCMPHKESSRTKYIVGSYLLGAMVGTLCYFAKQELFLLLQTNHIQVLLDEIFGAISIGLTIFLMVVLNLEHPPAVALAFGLVLHEWSLAALLVTSCSIGMMILFRWFFSDYLIDLD